MGKKDKINGAVMHMRINGDLKQAIVKCAASRNEKPAVFTRRALVNLLMEEGIYDFGEAVIDPWQGK